MCGKGICDTIQPTDYSEKGIYVTTVLNKLINEKGICVLNHLFFFMENVLLLNNLIFFKGIFVSLQPGLGIRLFLVRDLSESLMVAHFW